MLAYLLAGEYASAGELARAASVTPATASGHLGKLLDARFVVCEPRGRHRYYRLADAEGRANFELAQSQRFILREERTWLEDVSATRDVARQVTP